MRYCILAAACLLAACGDEPRYHVYGVPIFGETVPTEAHYRDNLHLLLNVISETTGDRYGDLLNRYKRVLFVEFRAEPIEYLGELHAGTYVHHAGAVTVWLQRPECLGYSAWAHEIAHHYQAFWELEPGHADDWLWGSPDGLVAVARARLQRELCPTPSADEYLLIRF